MSTNEQVHEQPVAEQPEVKQLHEGQRITEDEAKAAGLQVITDAQQIANIIINWHIDLCNQGQHVLNLDLNNPDDPQKAVIRVYEPLHADADEKGWRALADTEIVAFKHGVRYLLDMVEQLPFSYTPTDADGKVLDEYAATQDLAQDAETQEPNQDSGA